MNQQIDHDFYAEAVNAVLSGELPFYPVYQLHAKNVDGKNFVLPSAEMLTRFPKFHGKDILPYFFFETLSDISRQAKINEPHTDLYKNFIFFQLETLACELEKNIDALGKNFVASFNLSPEYFDQEFKNKYLEILSKHPKLSQHNIALELTETYPYPTSVSQSKKRKEFISNMKDLQNGGTIIVLDDFNTNFSDEKTLASFPFDVVKIDNTKFWTLMEQITNPNFEQHFSCPNNLPNELAEDNVLDILFETLKIMRLHGIPAPNKIICEGLKENSCSKNPSKNIPRLINRYYGDKIKEFGFSNDTFLYQGYEINVPFRMKNLLDFICQNQLEN